MTLRLGRRLIPRCTLHDWLPWFNGENLFPWLRVIFALCCERNTLCSEWKSQELYRRRVWSGVYWRRCVSITCDVRRRWITSGWAGCADVVAVRSRDDKLRPAARTCTVEERWTTNTITRTRSVWSTAMYYADCSGWLSKKMRISS